MRLKNQENARPRAARRSESVILFTVSSHLFAIAANAVHEIRSTDSLSGVATPFVHPELVKVRHVLQREHRPYYVVNACAQFHLPISRPLLVLVLRDRRAAVLVDRIERMTEITMLHALPQAFGGEERQWYRGLALLSDRVIPVVNPSAFLTDRELKLIEAAQPGDAAGGSATAGGAVSV